jgi:peptidoglycan hydrolase CwlO-like protein
MKINNKNKFYLKWLWWPGVFAITIFAFYYVKADSILDISGSDAGVSEETQEKIDELNRKAEIYRQIVEIKEKQGESLQNQLSITDSNIVQLQAEIDMSTEEINELNRQILILEKKIEEKNEALDLQKKLLSKILQSYYQINQDGLVSAYLSNGDIASFMLTKDRISQTGSRIKALISSINENKKNLEEQSKQLDEKKSEIVGKNQELQDKNVDLESYKNQRESLLTQTKGEEDRYRKLLENIQIQKQELLNIDEFFAASGLSIDSYPKPPESLLASIDWYYSQRDPRWANEKIGISGLTMKSYGCAVSCVAMVFTELGESITPSKLVKKPIYTESGLIYWPNKSFEEDIKLDSSGYDHGNINWKTIDSQIAKGNPVIVYIKKTKGSGGHYVVIHHKDPSTGKYVVHDPYFGPNIYFDTSRALVGAIGVDSGTIIDQMIIYNN